MKSEIRDHLRAGEVEIDSPLYGVMLLGADRAVMTAKLFDDKQKAMDYLKKFDHQAYVVRIMGTNT